MSNDTPQQGSALAALLAKRANKPSARVVDTGNVYAEVMAEMAQEALGPQSQGDSIRASSGVRLIAEERKK
jgi:hypothetical protein